MTHPVPSDEAPVPAPVPAPASRRPSARPRRKRWPITLALLAGVAFLLLFFIVSTEVLHYTESTAFCSLCHVMKPEVTAYHNSAHARAECGTCHIGPGAVPAIQAKLANVRYLWVYPTNQYERPIPSPIHSLRPVEVVCEQCHWPEKFYADRVVVKNEFAPDEANSLTQVAFNIRTGGGEATQGYGRGIHWHIANPVYYIATDEDRQDIPWVSAEFGGVVTEFLAVDSNLTPEALATYEKRKMDCVDCHNRASHDFRRPAELLDEALAQGVLPSLPFIKQQGVKVLEQQYATEEEAAGAIAAVETFYQNEQPAVYAEREGDVRAAVKVLQDIFDRTQFPFMNVTWESHQNNIGHKDFPGCFRCQPDRAEDSGIGRAASEAGDGHAQPRAASDERFDGLPGVSRAGQGEAVPGESRRVPGGYVHRLSRTHPAGGRTGRRGARHPAPTGRHGRLWPVPRPGQDEAGARQPRGLHDRPVHPVSPAGGRGREHSAATCTGD